MAEIPGCLRFATMEAEGAVVEEIQLVPAEPVDSPTGGQVKSSWPGVVRVETYLGDMHELLGKESYDRMIAFQMAMGGINSIRARMGGNLRARGAVPEL